MRKWEIGGLDEAKIKENLYTTIPLAISLNANPLYD